jgi:putative transposase
MPWKETCRMEERFRLIEAMREEVEPSLAEVCRRFGISRKTAYKWLRRYAAEGADGLKDRVSVARVQVKRLSVELEDAVVVLRKQHSFWGPKKLRAVLAERQPELEWPAASTIGEVLKRRGLIRPKRRRVAVLRGVGGELSCSAPNELWCMDFKGSFLLGDGSRCRPFTLTDAHSRFLLRCEGLEAENTELVKAALTLAFMEFGMPLRLRSDNGSPFGAQSPGGLSRLSVWLLKLGVIPEFIRPGHPEDNPRHERMHRPLKAETANPPEKNQADQQRSFDRFRRVYNEERPHEALGQVPPKRWYEPSPRHYTGRLSSPSYTDCLVRFAGRTAMVNIESKVISVGVSLSMEPIGFRKIGPALYEALYGPIRLGFVLTTEAKPRLRPEAPASAQPRLAPNRTSQEGSGSIPAVELALNPGLTANLTPASP